MADSGTEIRGEAGTRAMEANSPMVSAKEEKPAPPMDQALAAQPPTQPGLGAPSDAGQEILRGLRGCLADPRVHVVEVGKDRVEKGDLKNQDPAYLVIDLGHPGGWSGNAIQNRLLPLLESDGIKSIALSSPARPHQPLPKDLDPISLAPLEGPDTVIMESMRDSLTGLLNRTGLRAAYNHLTGLSVVARTPLSLAFLDIDHFKAINDCYGHAMGDQVLNSLTASLQAVLRISDVFSRWGGDEFVVMLMNADSQEGRGILSKGLALFSEQRFSLPEEAALGASFSAGLIEVSKFESLDSAIARADKILYKAKKGQVGCVLTEEDRFAIPPQVVLAEDDDSTALIVFNFLKHEGFDVVRCRDGEEVLGMAPNLRASLFIIDLMMPKLHGLKLLKSLRRIPRYSRTPIILLTAKRASADVVHGLEAGADDYVAKPFSPVELMARVKRLLKIR